MAQDIPIDLRTLHFEAIPLRTPDGGRDERLMLADEELCVSDPVAVAFYVLNPLGLDDDGFWADILVTFSDRPRGGELRPLYVVTMVLGDPIAEAARIILKAAEGSDRAEFLAWCSENMVERVPTKDGFDYTEKPPPPEA